MNQKVVPTASAFAIITTNDDGTDMDREEPVQGSNNSFATNISDRTRSTNNKEEITTDRIQCPSKCFDNPNQSKYLRHKSDDDDDDDRRQSRNRNRRRTTTTTTQSNTRIFYLILVHNQRSMNDALHLFRAIRHPNNIIAIHVDSKAKDLLEEGTTTNSNTNTTLPLLKEIQDCSCGRHVHIQAVHDVQWGQWSMNLATLWGMQLTVDQYAGQWDSFINLAGDTLPVYTPTAMAETISQLPYNFVTSRSCETGLFPTNVYYFPSFWHKRKHYTNNDSEQNAIFTYMDDEKGNVIQDQQVQIHFGSQWVILFYLPFVAG